MTKLTQAEIDRQDAWEHHCATQKPTLQDAIDYDRLDSRMGRLMYHLTNQTEAYMLSSEIRDLPTRETIIYREVKDGILKLHDIIRDDDGKIILLPPEAFNAHLKTWGIEIKLRWPVSEMKEEEDKLYGKWVKGINASDKDKVILSPKGEQLKTETLPKKIPERYQKAHLKFASLSSIVLHYPWIIDKNKEWFDGVLDELRKEKANAPATA
jgi:hypothetical protein